MLFLQIEDAPGDVTEYPLEKEGYLLLEVLQGAHPRATGLVYVGDDGRKRRTMATQGHIRPPPDGWSDKVVYSPFTPVLDRDVDQELVELKTQVKELSMRSPAKLVMAPERKLPVFDGKAGEVEEFIAARKTAFSRYGVPEEERALIC